MPSVVFAKAIQRHVEVPDRELAGATVREVLEAAFERHPRLRGYVVDEQGALRRHVAVFVDGRAVADRRGLSDEVAGGAEVYVMQALSGG